ncbi:hypothetical protein UES1_521 [Escherichia phage UE-S1]|nr:hypothetical protein UES1_521 [Escherichia phage UE-S1]
MAVFSNLEGTMKKSFILGKNGAQITTNGSVVQIQNYSGTKLLPISAGDPTANTHLVTLGYLNAHSGTGSSGILRGTSAPDESIGSDGDVYFLVDETNVLQIYIKDLGIWKSFKGSSHETDSSYVTTETVPVSAFTLVPDTTDHYTYTIPASVHGRGPDIMIQLHGDSPGSRTLDSVFQTSVVVNGAGDITIDAIGKITDYINVIVNIIGATTMTVPYSKLINQDDWISNKDEFTITIPASEHKQSPENLYVSIYANKTPGSVSTSPFELVVTGTQISNTGDVIFTSDVTFSGKIVISGK